MGGRNVSSAVLPSTSVYCLHGQYSYSGHVIKDTAMFAKCLPGLPNELNLIVVRKEGAAQSYHNFYVRKSRVLCALQWLVRNNVYYCNINISPEVLSLLPKNGNLTSLCSITIDSHMSGKEAQGIPNNDSYNTHLERSFVPIVAQRARDQAVSAPTCITTEHGQQLVLPPSMSSTLRATSLLHFPQRFLLVLLTFLLPDYGW